MALFRTGASYMVFSIMNRMHILVKTRILDIEHELLI